MTDRAREAARDPGRTEAGASLADELIDELVPTEVDWRSVVTSYPRLSISVAAVAGFWLGSTRGRAIVAGVTGMVADAVNESINEFFGRDVV